MLILQQFIYAQKMTIDTNMIYIGEQTTLTISNNIQDTENWPEFKDTIVSGLEIINSTIDTINEKIIQKIIITAFDTGNYYIPTIYFSNKSRVEGIILNVNTVELEDTQLKDIKGPIHDRIGWNEIWPWLFLILILLILILISKKWVFKWKKTETIKKVEKRIPADIIALTALKKLEKRNLIEKNNIKEYYSIISEITRRYIENRFNFIALELTTEEILSEIKIHVNSDNLNNIKTLLERADLVKFAKSKPEKNTSVESMNLANNFILNTKEKLSND